MAVHSLAVLMMCFLFEGPRLQGFTTNPRGAAETDNERLVQYQPLWADFLIVPIRRNKIFDSLRTGHD